MTSLQIEICVNHRGKFDIRIGDIEGCSTSSNLTKQEVLDMLKEELDECKLTESQKNINKENNINENVNMDLKSTKNEFNSQQEVLPQSDKSVSLIKSCEEGLYKQPVDIHTQNKELLDKDYAKTTKNAEVKE